MTANIGRNKTTVRLTDRNADRIRIYSSYTCSWQNAIVNKALDEFFEKKKVAQELSEAGYKN